MSEKEAAQPQSPFERIRYYYDKRGEHHDTAKIELKDGTKISIIKRNTRVNDPDLYYGYNVSVKPIRGKKTPNIPDFDFLIDHNGRLETITFPLRVKIGDTEVKVTDHSAAENFYDVLMYGSGEDKSNMAKVLVDWFDNIIKESKCSYPPITASIPK